MNDSDKSNNSSTTTLVLGLSLLVAVLAINPWTLARGVAGDGTIDSPSLVWLIVLANIACFLLGAFLIRRKPGLQSRLARALVGTCSVLVLLLSGLSAVAAFRPRSEYESRIAHVHRAESVYLGLSSTFSGTLNRSALDLAVPGAASRAIFAESVWVRDLASTPEVEASEILSGRGLAFTEQIASETGKFVAREELALWKSFFSGIDFLKYGEFKIIFGDFSNAEESEYRAEMKFYAHGRDLAGRWVNTQISVNVLWRLRASALEPTWEIASWDTVSLKGTLVDRPLFEERLSDVLIDSAARERVRRSLHEELVLDWFLEQDFEPPHPFFTLQAFDRNPGISIADVDGDGAEDIYLMARWGKNQLLHRREYGTFEEAAARFGLDIEDHCTSALFADFDNDGDADLMLGRSLARSQYLVNQGGRFVSSPELISMELPFAVSSISAADYDGDGLLDLYISTYGAEMFLDPSTASEARERFLTPGQAEQFLERSEGSNWVSSRVGPPNLLLHNMGDGRFEPAPMPAGWEVWRNTFQASWADYDLDGDPDLYVANDFGPNNMLRNDGGGVFVDNTESTDVADLGFGMGASWADYDNDGQSDLYVSNMYSKAGRRIMKIVGGEADRWAPLARGNTLFRNRDGRFERVSGTTPETLQVEVAGWSYGSQFVDVNNDGFPDVHALSGYYTAPDEVAIPVDT